MPCAIVFSIEDVDADIDHLKNRIAALIQEDCSEDAEMPYTFQCSQQPMDESQPASNSASSVDEDADTDDREWVSEPDTHVLQQRAVDEDDGWEHEQTQIRMLLEAEQRLSQSADVLQLLAEDAALLTRLEALGHLVPYAARPKVESLCCALKPGIYICHARCLHEAM
eukprot:5082070-Amphidinium_carterae.1